MTRWSFCKSKAKDKYDKETREMIDFWANTDKCFGIMNVSKTGGYFTLSGSHDIKDSSLNDKFTQVSNEYENNIVKYLNHNYFKNLKYAYLTGEVFAYGKLKKGKLEPFRKKIKLKEHSKPPDFKDYACCERKMLSAVQASMMKGHIELFTRWKPCPRCVPALNEYRDKLVCKVYASNKDKFLRDTFKHERKIITTMEKKRKR